VLALAALPLSAACERRCHAEAGTAGRVKVEPDISIGGYADIFVIGDTSTAHLYFLVSFCNRFMVGLTQLWNYLTFERGARLITGIDLSAAAAPLPVLTPKADMKDVTKRAA
jgi:hypothetical protein